MDGESYKNLVKQVYSLISDEINYYSLPERSGDLPGMYPKFQVMYQFFRMLRGEAFTDVRPHTPESQNEFYEMENNLRQKIEEVKSKIDPDDL